MTGDHLNLPVLTHSFPPRRSSHPPATAAAAIAEDYARFVCDYEPARLKPCANPTCTMVFYDTGRNNTRRWCTMSICGNRDTVARYRSRRGGTPDAGGGCFPLLRPGGGLALSQDPSERHPLP